MQKLQPKGSGVALFCFLRTFKDMLKRLTALFGLAAGQMLLVHMVTGVKRSAMFVLVRFPSLYHACL